jgi:hypothetical protein
MKQSFYLIVVHYTRDSTQDMLVVSADTPQQASHDLSSQLHELVSADCVSVLDATLFRVDGEDRGDGFWPLETQYINKVDVTVPGG